MIYIHKLLSITQFFSSTINRVFAVSFFTRDSPLPERAKKMKPKSGTFTTLLLTFLVTFPCSALRLAADSYDLEPSHIRKREPTPSIGDDLSAECNWVYNIVRNRAVDPPFDHHRLSVRFELSEYTEGACDRETLLTLFRTYCERESPEIDMLEQEPKLLGGACTFSVSLRYKRALDAPLIDLRDAGLGHICLYSALWCSNPGFTELPVDCVRAPRSRKCSKGRLLIRDRNPSAGHGLT